jgi:hypothetical protein
VGALEEEEVAPLWSSKGEEEVASLEIQLMN